MANIKSAKKRARQNQKRHKINLARKSEIKTIVKKYVSAINEKNVDEAKNLLRLAECKISRAKGKGLLKKNTAARKVSRLSKKLVALQK